MDVLVDTNVWLERDNGFTPHAGPLTSPARVFRSLPFLRALGFGFPSASSHFYRTSSFGSALDINSPTSCFSLECESLSMYNM